MASPMSSVWMLVLMLAAGDTTAVVGDSSCSSSEGWREERAAEPRGISDNSSPWLVRKWSVWT